MAGGPFGVVTEAQAFGAIAPHRERIVSRPRLPKGIVKLTAR
jgi:hypothetical protein